MTVVSTLPPSVSLELDRERILKIFSSIGRCRFLDEKHFDACTALSGSGPAFACIFLEAMADGGVMMGLPRAEALELAAQSTFSSLAFDFCWDRKFMIYVCSPVKIALQGAARMTLGAGTHPAQLKDAVTSKDIRPQTVVLFTDLFPSSGWMYHRWFARFGRWKGPFDNCPSHSDCNGACQ